MPDGLEQGGGSRIGVHEHRCKWRRRFLKERIEGLSVSLGHGRERSPRPIRWPRLSSGRSARRRRTPPIGRCAQWPKAPRTRRSGGVAFGVQPHRSETFKLSSDLRGQELICRICLCRRQIRSPAGPDLPSRAPRSPHSECSPSDLARSTAPSCPGDGHPNIYGSFRRLPSPVVAPSKARSLGRCPRDR